MDCDSTSMPMGNSTNHLLLTNISILRHLTSSLCESKILFYAAFKVCTLPGCSGTSPGVNITLLPTAHQYNAYEKIGKRDFKCFFNLE